MINTQLPVFLENNDIHRILNEVIAAIPSDSKVYLHGGALRNSIYYRYFGEKMTQRDFDLIVVGEKESFVDALLAQGFIYGKKNTASAVVLKKPRFENASENFADWVYLDIVFRQNTTAEQVLKEKVNFTINGSALELKLIEDPAWFDNLITISGALEDIQAKQIRTNVRYPINIYACVRFVSRGFLPPSKEEIGWMIEDLAQVTKEKFEINRDKVISYVGSAEEVRAIVRRLNIPVDILDFDAISQFLNQKSSQG